MPRGLTQFVAILQLSRAGLVLTAVSNIWLVAMLSRATGGGGGPRLAMWAYLLVTAAVAAGMYTFGMVLNDLLDMRRDRLFAPQRPLPSRRLRPAAAVGLAVGALLVAIAATLPLSVVSTLLCLLTAALVLFYNGPGKYLTGIGVLTLGLIRAGNMLTGDPGFPYLWPIWLTLTHVVALSALCHRLEGKRPSLTAQHIWIVTLGWVLVTLVMLGWMREHDRLTMVGRPWLWVGPTAAAAAFVGVALYTIRDAARPQAAGMVLMKRGLMWLIVYDAAWLFSARLWWQAALVASLLPVTYLLMEAVRKLKALSEGPVGSQR